MVTCQWFLSALNRTRCEKSPSYKASGKVYYGTCRWDQDNAIAEYASKAETTAGSDLHCNLQQGAEFDNGNASLRWCALLFLELRLTVVNAGKHKSVKFGPPN
jgi:hypothetical protein